MIKKTDYSEGRDTRVMLPNNHANIVSRFLAMLLSIMYQCRQSEAKESPKNAGICPSPLLRMTTGCFTAGCFCFSKRYVV